MSVNNEISTSGPYAGNDVTVAFSITFTILQRSQVVVYKSDVDGVITTLVLDTDYSVTGFPSAGTVVMTVPPATGEEIFLVSNYQETQLTEFESQGGFFPDVHEEAFDKLTYLILQANRNTLQLPVSFSRTSNSLPTARNGFGFRWDENDNLVEADLTVSITTDAIITFESVLQMKAFAPTPEQIGQLVKCKRYYTGGELVEGLEYEIVASATVDGFIDHAVVGGFAILIASEVTSAQAGAKEVGDDVAPLQALLSRGGIVNLGASHAISAPLNITEDCIISSSKNETVITPSFAGNCFNSSASNLSISKIKCQIEGRFLNQTSLFNHIKVEECDFDGTDDSFLNYFIYATNAGSGKLLEIRNNKTSRCTSLFADDCPIDDLFITDNDFDKGTRFVVRNIPQIGVLASQRIRVFNNNVTDINGSLTDKGTTARFLQLFVEDTAWVCDNVLDGAESTVASNFLYLQDGNLVCQHNVVKAIKSISSISIIDDKNVDKLKRHWDISHNTFDQRGILLADSPEAAIRLNEVHNVNVSHNKFIGLSCFPFRAYHSLDLGRPPENVSFSENEIYDLQFPVVAQVYQNVKNASIKNNKVYSMSNPNTISVNGRTENRVADIYQSFDNGDNLDGVEVFGNVVFETPTASFAATIYRNNVATTSTISNVSVVGNEMKQGATGALIRFTSGLTVDKVDLINNIGPTGMVETIGAFASLRTQNNVLT